MNLLEALTAYFKYVQFCRELELQKRNDLCQAYPGSSAQFRPGICPKG